MSLIFWQPYLIALVIGLLVGIEREKSQPSEKTMGVRTFLLISLLGAIAGGVEGPGFSAFLSFFALSLITISYFNQTRIRDSHVDRGLTTEFAAGIIFVLGYTAHTDPALSALLGPVVAVILFSKSFLHRFTEAIKPAELKAALLLLLGGVVVANLVPDTPVDPWGIFNPKKFSYLILTLATLEFSSYVAVKLIGGTKGTLLIGFLGGLVSSTAVLISSARQSKLTPQNWKTHVSSSLAAKLAAFLELLLIVALISPDLLFRISLPIGTALILGGIGIFIFSRKASESTAQIGLKSPLDWMGVLRLAILLALILASISFAERFLGDNATMTLAFLTGLFELHGVSLATATMHSQNQLSAQSASLSILIAVMASLVAKIALAFSISRGPFSKAMTSVFVPMILVVALVAWLTHEYFQTPF